MKIKTSELEGAALDWAVAKAVGSSTITLDGGLWYRGHNCLWSPSTDWSQCGPLIAEHKILFDTDDWSIIWATAGNSNISKGGDSHLIAACRAIVAAKLGDVVDVPEELA